MTRRRPPPWWPEGEPWPPRPPWASGERERRRAHGWHGPGWGHGPGSPRGPRGPGGPGGPGGPHWPPWPGRRQFRRRFLVAAAAVLVGLIGLVLLAGVLFGGRWRDDGTRGPDRNRPPPVALVAFAGTVLLIGGAGATLAYRRLSGPVNELLDAADQVAGGEFDVTVEPGGPRELQSLALAFNRMADRLGAAEGQRRRFLADVSHELRTPLAVLQSGIEAQLDDIHPRDDQHLASLLDEARRLGRLVDDLHTLALSDAGKLVLHLEPVDVLAVVDDALDRHRPLAERSGVTLRGPDAAPASAPQATTLDADPSRLRQVLDNLLANAVRHSPPGGEVQVGVEATPTGDAVRVVVADAGPGFPPDQLAQIFDRFTRAVDSHGSGLGLSIVRDLVEAHGGRVEAANRPGGGAAVSFARPRSTL